jgi:hypothetical protein
VYCILHVDPSLPHCPFLYFELSSVICVTEETNCDLEYLRLQGIILCHNCRLSLLTTTTVQHIGAVGRVAFINMTHALVGCGNQWFSYRIMTCTRTLEHEAHIPTVHHVYQVFVAEGIRCT